MAESTVEICNMAIAHLGSGKSIASLEERSNEADACSLFYESALKTTLRGKDWPFATAFADLALVEEDPTSEYDYSYRYPSGCVKFRRILSGTRNDTRSTRIHYRIGKDSSGKLIFTDQDDAECEYTDYVDDPTLFPEDFALALSYQLAYLIAPRITGADPFKMGDRALANYRITIGMAAATASNEQQDEAEPDSELISIRG